MDLIHIADKLMDMKPDSIPEFVLLKDIYEISPDTKEYQNAYEKVCNHPYVEEISMAQNDRGFWPPFHGYSEGRIRRCLSIGLDKEHDCFKKVTAYLIQVLQEKEKWDQFEKQDNESWWTNMFVPLVSAAMLSLVEPNHDILITYRQKWSDIANRVFSSGAYDKKENINAIIDSFGFCTKRPI